MAAPGSVIKADFKKEKLYWTCKCGEKLRYKFEWFSEYHQCGERYCGKCDKRFSIEFFRSIYSIKMQERILEQQAQQAALLAKFLSMHALGDDALMQ